MTIDHLSVKRSSSVRTSVVVEGTATPDTPVVVENQSSATFAPLRTADAFVHTRANAAGHFRVAVPSTHEGDHLRVSSGHSVVSIRVQNTARVDGRPPVVHQQGLRLVPADGGGFAFTHVQKSTVVGEPKQVVRFTNDRSGDIVDFVLDERGGLPKGARLPGRAGDVFRIATTDGAHNTDLANSAGSALVAPSSSSSSQPPPLAEHEHFKSQRLGGPLCIDVPQPGTVKQGKIGDCWLVSAVDAIAVADPKRLRALFRENDDGTVTFTFHRYDHSARRRVTEDVTVTNSALNDGGPVYGSTSTNERWFALLEKAMAGFKGGYEGIVSGYPYEAFEALLGTPGKHHDFDVSTPDAVWAALNGKDQAMATWTRVESPALSFAKTGLAADHAYAVFGTSERDGERFVMVRNPWGSNKAAWGGARDGIKLHANGLVEMPLQTFMTLFAGLGTASV